MLFEAVILSVIVGFVFKGNIRNLADLNIRHSWIFFLGLFARFLPALINLFFSKSPFIDSSSKIVALIPPVSFLLSYVLILIGLFFNLHYKTLWVVIAGVLLNLIVVAANGGFMPVNTTLLIKGGYDMEKAANNFLDANHILSDENTWLLFLGDTISLAGFYPIKKIISLGDIVMSSGIFVFIFTKMKIKKKENKDGTEDETKNETIKDTDRYTE